MYKNPTAAPAAAKNFRVFAMVKGARSGAGQWRKKVTHPPPLFARKSYIPPPPMGTYYCLCIVLTL